MAKTASQDTVDPFAMERDELSGWQQRSLDRSLVHAKRRALDKSTGFVRAAMELLDETGALTFTVQDVVDRSKLSLRSFYQSFASKDDLLLALFEEYVVLSTAWQEEQMSDHDDAIEQIRVFLTSLWAGKLKPDVTVALAVYHVMLAATRPADLAHALGPQRAVLHAAIERGVAAGQVRSDIDSHRLAEILLHTGNAAVQTTILQTASESPDDVWAFCLGALRPPA